MKRKVDNLENVKEYRRRSAGPCRPLPSRYVSVAVTDTRRGTRVIGVVRSPKRVGASGACAGGRGAVSPVTRPE
ncbi:hypothetical protein EVAR_19611_1 [Eumeta japonica]|uniref:Uncharacterized protein n=1 Tax=Eumeta variegata TaxID=151549 RepID=A0A4C1UFL5_EUMVA|nr:hypothetical protein EVAR_19611_1 [Eumeta japonica]